MASTVTRPASEVLGGPDRVGRRPPAWPLAAMSYLAGSLALHHRMLAAPGTATGDVPSDSGLVTWWSAWTWSALRHGLTPLFTTATNAPDGVNALWNTSVPVLGVLLAPITATAGPRAAYDVGMVVGPVVSGLAAYLALRPWCRRAWVRTVGGAMVGFGPFALAHAGVGHLNLVWTALLRAVHALVWPPPSSTPCCAPILRVGPRPGLPVGTRADRPGDGGTDRRWRGPRRPEGRERGAPGVAAGDPDAVVALLRPPARPRGPRRRRVAARLTARRARHADTAVPPTVTPRGPCRGIARPRRDLP